jgi:hypothetical protein
VGTALGIAFSLTLSGIGFYRSSHIGEGIVTPQNIEAKVRQWLDEFNITSGKVNDDHAFFNYSATKEGTPPTTIAIEKEHPKYLTMASRITLSKEDQASYEKLSEQQKTEFRMLLGAELAKAHIGSAPDFSAGFILTVLTRIAITPDLNEADFYRGMDQVNYGFILANNTIELFLARSRQPSPTPDTAASPP